MKRISISLFLFLLASITAFALNDTITVEILQQELKPLKLSIQSLQSEIAKLKTDVVTLNTKLDTANFLLDSVKGKFSDNINTISQTTNQLKNQITTYQITTNKRIIDVDQSLKRVVDSLGVKISQNNATISQTANNLGIQITTTEQETNKRIEKVVQSLSKNSLYGIIGVLSAIILAGLLFWLISKRQRTDKTDVEGKLENRTAELKKDVLSHIENTKSELTTENAKLDIQLLNLIKKQLKVADKINTTEPAVDHTFHKNSANELQRIANYANTLDPNSQTANALQGSLLNLRNYFKTSEYEITDYTGKDFDARIPMEVKDAIFDDTLKIGQEIITRTKKPQIKFKGIVIQKAEVITKYNN